MSERSGLGTKGEKNQGKFKGIDINNIYKGTSVTQPKSAPGESILDVVCGTFELSVLDANYGYVSSVKSVFFQESCKTSMVDLFNDRVPIECIKNLIKCFSEISYHFCYRTSG